MMRDVVDHGSLGVYLTGEESDGRTLVVVFLRGGADALSLVVPVFEDAYYRARPRLGIRAKGAIALDERFSIPRRMAPLEPLFREGELAVVHAAGSEEDSRSHFEAQDFMEHGGLEAGGWLGRFLRFHEGRSGSPLSAVAFGTTAPESLRGAPATTVIESLAEFAVPEGMQSLLEGLGKLYGLDPVVLGPRGEQTMRALRSLATLAENRNAPPRNGVVYGDDAFSRSLAQAARLIRSGLGVEAITVDLHGWDSHLTQETLIEPLMEHLASGLAAFRRDLGERIATTSVVVMSEFGRRLRENSAFGTDHGRAGVMFVLGGGTPGGGNVIVDWPGLEDDQLEGPGDLRVTTNYRDVLWSVLGRHRKCDPERVFPGHTLRPAAV
ncbi:MAG TPA: DUF1501 domain-containing protein [Verrucomicrobiales bacterium]|nr:DUF1501 domain-containing protein [Verrucomicrobiales bacterium]